MVKTNKKISRKIKNALAAASAPVPFKKKPKAKTKKLPKSKIDVPPDIKKKMKKEKKEKKKKKKDLKKNLAKAKESWQQQQQQQIQLPAKSHGQGPIPWMTQIKTVPDIKDGPTKRHICRLPTDDADPLLMAYFSQELIAFAEYARLSPCESQARLVLVEQMHSVAQRVFHNDPHIDVNALELQVFGSYACPDVCTFRSDVDVALWGVIQPKINKKQQQEQEQQQEEQQVSKTEQQQQSMTAAERKEARKQKWRSALAMMEQENELTPDGGLVVAAAAGAPAAAAKNNIGDDAAAPKGDGSRKKKNTKEELEDVEEEDDVLPLFVVDRTGVVDLTNNEDEDPMDPTTTTRNNENMSDGLSKSQRSASVSTQATAVTESEASVIDNNNKVVEAENDDSSDDDTADKLTESRATPTLQTTATTRDGGESRAFDVASSGSESDNEEDDDEDDDMAVHFYNQAATQPEGEPSDFSRRKVLDGLQRYFKGLRNSGMSRNIRFISRARVPIIKLESHLGVELDCSIGGMNGADTSLYAKKMSQHFQSFSPVVIALKMIMGQQNLDIPFNGGLGSYKLYVLVASHIAKHMELGGRDDPGEIFLSFLFRYGVAVGHHHTHRDTRTHITMDDTISCGYGGIADLSNVFLIADCRSLFGSLWKRLWSCLRKSGKSATADTPRVSFLAEVIHTSWLDHSRQMNIANAQDFVKQQSRKEPAKTAKRQHSPAVLSAGRVQRDLTEEELIAGYIGRPAKKAKRFS